MGRVGGLSREMVGKVAEEMMKSVLGISEMYGRAGWKRRMTHISVAAAEVCVANGSCNRRPRIPHILMNYQFFFSSELSCGKTNCLKMFDAVN